MKSLRFIGLSVFMLCTAVAGFAQGSPCALKQSPELRGFRLGMNVFDVRANLEDTTQFDIKISDSKAQAFGIRIPAAELKEALAEGIDEINLSFIDSKLAVIKVTYNAAMTWEGAQDFLTKESASMGLPKPTAANSSGSRGNEKYRIECKSFAVTLAYSFGVSPNVTINDMAAQKLADQRLEDGKKSKSIVIGPGTTTTGPGRPPK